MRATCERKGDQFRKKCRRKRASTHLLSHLGHIRRASRHPSSSRLQQESENIARDEELRDPGRADEETRFSDVGTEGIGEMVEEHVVLSEEEAGL
jgi:hypothetical protein